uniref:sodium/bile acid cotransporter n=1 Tax=Scatophagus argus TaxID=75038 RepID=UPI001ED832EA|nr:sodium/bile acid cotransporter [Scatophagus argus]
MDPTADFLSDPPLWQNESFLFNVTDANATSVHTIRMSPAMNKAINVTLIVSIIITMVSMGCTIKISQIKLHIVKPKGVVTALLAQYGVMPLTAFGLAKAFQLSKITATVILICGCCPGGSLSNVLTLLLRGDMNLSILMTCCSTLLALGMMPLLLFIYCQGFPHLQNSVPYVKIIASLFMVIIPCSFGTIIGHYRPQYTKTLKKVGVATMLTAVLLITTFASIGVGHSILAVLSPTLMAISALMPLIGYAFGYFIPLLFKLNQAERRTIAMETGCQNIQVCTAILKLAFPIEIIGPLFLFPLVYGVFELIEAAVLIVLLKCYRKFTEKSKTEWRRRTRRCGPRRTSQRTVPSEQPPSKLHDGRWSDQASLLEKKRKKPIVESAVA